MESGWIRVQKKEELPNGKTVFLCYESNLGEQKFTIGGLFDDSNGNLTIYDYMNDDTIQNVVAYMPFPSSRL